MNLRMLVAGLSAVAMLAACGKSESSKNTKADSFQGEKVGVSEDSELALTEETVSGTGSFVYKDPIGESSEDKSYVVSFKLADKASLELRSHTNNKLSKGVNLRFTRDGKNVKLVYGGESEKPKTIELLKNVDESKNIELSIDVHNSETPSHVLVWSSSEAKKGEESALFNSDADVDTREKGTGVYWGFILDNATLNSAKSGGPIFGH